MITINGKDYKINLDIKLGTEKLMRFVHKNPTHPKVAEFMERILKDLLIPAPTSKEIFEFRYSDRDLIFEQFTKEIQEVDRDFKKKRSR